MSVKLSRKVLLADRFTEYWHNDVIKENEFEAYFNILSRKNYTTFSDFVVPINVCP